MTGHDTRRLFGGVPVLATFFLLVVPVAVGAVDTTFMTPLALPGYLVLTIGSAVGNLLFPNFALWVYWVPFVVACYVLALFVGVSYRRVR